MSRPLFSRTERAWLLGGLRASSAAALALLGLALIIAMMSYHPADPGYFSATFRKPQNMLGEQGALIADLLHRSVGVAGYAIGALGLVWALRIFLRAWPDRLLRRLICAPLALLGLAALASGEPDIAQSGGGLGGLLGDMIFSMMNSGLPLESPQIRYIATVVLLALLTPPLLLAALGGTSFGAVSWSHRQVMEAGQNLLATARRGWERRGRLGGLTFGTAFFAWASGLFAGMNQRRAQEPVEEPAAQPTPYADRREPTVDSAPEGVFGPSPRRNRVVPKAPPPGEAGLSGARRRATEPTFSREAQAAPGLAQTPDEAASADAVSPNVAPQEFTSVTMDGEPSPDSVPLPGWAAEAAEAGDALSSQVRENEAAFAASSTDGISVAEDQADSHRIPHADLGHEIETGSLPEPNEAAAEQSAADEPAPEAVESGPAQAPQPDPEEIETAERAGPSLDLLVDANEAGRPHIDERDLAEKADRLQNVLQDYGVRGDIIHVSPGPVVSLFELEPAPGLKAARVVGLADDIARSMSAAACRVSPVPGKNLIGIELPNDQRETVLLSELLASDAYQEGDWTLPLALGKNISGEPVIADLARMPHLLIAGTTGSGKSVAINTMLLSLLYRLSPAEARLILIDPKMLELSVYNGAPHLLAPVVTDPKQAVAALRWVVREMETRYQRMAKLNVRSLESYNAKISEAGGETLTREVQVGFCEETGAPLYETQATPAEPMARIVVVIDEMADLMMVAGKEIERLVQRLAQMARAAGIHLVMATQRPSVDVITGVIKANFPIRISFQVTSKIDSRTILNEPGAEQLLGKGDMLFTTGSGKLQRLHGPFVSDAEVEAVAARLGAMEPVSEPIDFDARPDPTEAAGTADPDDDSDEALYERAVSIVRSEQKASTSFLQRRLQIGYNRAARLVDRLEEQGVITPANHSGKREVLLSAEAE